MSQGDEGGLMRENEAPASWVVYRMTIHGRPTGASAVCEQSEWAAMERARPGYHALVRAGVPSEGEAERLARGCAPGGGQGTPPSA
jgi:hypothetical protein